MSGAAPTAAVAALGPHVTELVRVPLVSPIRTRMGDLIPDVQGAVVRFPRWTGPAFVDDLGRKATAMVELDGEHLFAELALLRLLQRAGWDGRWVITTGAKHGEVWKLLTRWQDAPRADQKHAPIEPERPRQLLTSIATINKPGRWQGCWGVFAWRGGDGADEFAFFEPRRTSNPAKERLKPPQEEWMRMALACHPGKLRPESFCVVLWDYE